MRFFILISYILLGYVALAAYPINNYPFVISGRAQGTTYEVKYYADKELVGKVQLDSIFEVIDRSMSLYRPESLISKFNSQSTKSIKLDDHMKNVVEASFYYNKITKGYFDITTFSLLKLWGFGPKGFNSNPSDKEVDSVMRLIGLDKLKFKGKKLYKKNSSVTIDLNGIAQGYTVDVISNFLKIKGIHSFIVEVGGEIFCNGLKPNGDSYRVEIQRPYSDQATPYKVVLNNKAITTSGSYEKYRVFNGQPISHHMNPFTGRPTINNTLSVTIIAPTAMEADALDNYLIFLKPDEAISFVESIPNVEAYIIYSENNTLKELQTSGFNIYIYN